MELCKYPKMENTRTFHIEAIQIPIVYNKYGDYDPNGMLYVLEEDAERIKTEALKRFEMEIPQPYKEVQPLVIRVNLGDTVKVRFRNSLNRRLSIHVQGLSYDVNTSDGSSVGYNADSTTSGEIWYTWYADTEGVYLFHDMADPRSTEDATNIHGLFGAVIVEAPEAKWFDPETGEELKSGLMADVYQPGKPAFREYSVFFHDELEILNKEGEQPIDPHTGLPSSTTAISYRSEPMRNRMPHSHDPADSGEDVSMSSWVYGDPAPPILFAYVGDPVKIRLLHGGIKETHVFHLHNHQWRLALRSITRITEKSCALEHGRSSAEKTAPLSESSRCLSMISRSFLTERASRLIRPRFPARTMTRASWGLTTGRSRCGSGYAKKKILHIFSAPLYTGTRQRRSLKPIRVMS